MAALALILGNNFLLSPGSERKRIAPHFQGLGEPDACVIARRPLPYVAVQDCDGTTTRSDASMLTENDIRAAARLLISQRGECAPSHAAIRAAQLMQEGNAMGGAEWLRVQAVAETLLRANTKSLGWGSRNESALVP